MTLARLEELFWRAVRSKAPPPEIAEIFVGDRRLDPVRRMGIYRSAYWARQERTLAQVFSRLHRRLGEDEFRKLSYEYIEAFPSRVAAIEWIGCDFPKFLWTHRPSLPREVFDLARLEWARLETLLAPDGDPPLAVAELAAADVPRACVSLRPDVRLLRILRSALDLWQHDSGAAGDPIGRCDRITGCVVWRSGHLVRHVEIVEPDMTALELLDGGEPFAVACEAFTGPDPVREATRAIGTWLARGWLCNLRQAGDV